MEEYGYKILDIKHELYKRTVLLVWENLNDGNECLTCRTFTAGGKPLIRKQVYPLRIGNIDQERIPLGFYGENYGNWMSNSVFYIIGGGSTLATVLAILSFICSVSLFSVLCLLLSQQCLWFC